MWAEVKKAKDENRRELVLAGKVVDDRITELSGKVDEEIYNLVNLNYLEVSNSLLSELSVRISHLSQLTTLTLIGNKLTSLPATIGELTALKLLDVSNNNLDKLPDLSGLVNLTTLNVSINRLAGSFPKIGLENCSKLSTIDVSVNKLESIGEIENCKLELLAQVIASNNDINAISSSLPSQWPALKKLNLAENSLTIIPRELGHLTKLKELSLAGNPLSDNRLMKMVSQKPTKSVMEYIRQHCPAMSTGQQASRNDDVSDIQIDHVNDSKGGSGKKNKRRSGKSENNGDSRDSPIGDLCDVFTVMTVSEEAPVVHFTSEGNLEYMEKRVPEFLPEFCQHPAEFDVKEIRPYIVICFVHNVDMQGEMFKQFINIQTKLHKTACANRTLATIATHDLKLVKGPMVYTALPPEKLTIQPLTGSGVISADKLVAKLKAEAEAMRKEKKRNTILGIHQYLPLLDKHPLYPCLMDAQGTTVSLPPLTNSYATRITEETTDLMIEVTSSTSLADAKKVMETLLQEMLVSGIGKPAENDVEKDDDQNKDRKHLLVAPGRVVNQADGSLRVLYPSKTDLDFPDSNRISVLRR